MASARAMKRAQGDPLLAAAQSAFGGGSDVSDESSSEDEGARASSKPLNAFALLGGDDDDDDDTPEESEEEPEPPPVVKEPTPPPASKKKKKKKKKKTKDDDADEAEADDDDDDDGMAEITAALKEIGETMPAPRPERDALSADASVSGRDTLMCVDTRRLKAEDELRSIFGASVIRAVETEDGGTTPTPTRWATSGVTHVRPGKEGRCRPSSRTRGPCWSRPRTGGRRTGPKAPASRWSASTRRDSSRLFGSFAPTTSQTPTPRINERWRRTTRTTCTTLLRYWPWHVDALAALSDVYHYAGEGSKSAELLERCLYAMEGAWHPWFAQCVADGTARMDARVNTDADTDSSNADANSLFFGCMFKHVQATTRRGCHRAALECAKLALSLDRSDPRGFLCALDYFALRCGEEDWLLDFADGFGGDTMGGGGGGLLSHPSYAYSTALARLGGGRPGRRLLVNDGLNKAGNKGAKGGNNKGGPKSKGSNKSKGPGTLSEQERKDADDALLRALLMHPAAAVAALTRMESSSVSGDATWQTILSHPHFAHARDECGSASLERLYDVFAERHHLLWRPDDALRWLKDSMRRAIDCVDGGDESTTIDGLTPSDFVAVRGETFPPSDHNAYSHLAVEDFSDVVKRQLDEENPFMRRLPPQPGPDDFANELGVDQGALMDAMGEMERELEAMGPEVMERARNMGPAEAARFLEAARAAAGNPGEAGGGGGGGGGVGRGNPLVEFIRTMFVQDPGDAGDGLARRIDRDVVDEAFNPE